MGREEQQRARSPEEGNGARRGESEKKTKAVTKLKRDYKDKPNRCRKKQPERKQADGRRRGRKGKGKSTGRNGEQRRGKNNVRKSWNRLKIEGGVYAPQKDI